MQPLPLFDDVVMNAPPTEGIKYAGSKLKILPHILRLVGKVQPETVLDGFSGTTRVSQALAKLGYTVICNDIAIWSQVFGTCYLLNDKERECYQPLIDHLNAVQPIDGWFTEHYGGKPNGGNAVQQDGLKKPWQIHNTRKLDGIREEIESLNLNIVDKSVVLTSLIIGLDRVDSSLGHFASYLKDWSPRSYGELLLKTPKVFTSSKEHQVFRKDALDIVQSVGIDLAYFDPPYGSNNEKMPPSRVRYAAYYHIWKSVCLFDQPELFGRAGRRKDSSDSVAVSDFEEFRRTPEGKFVAVEAIDRLVRDTRAHWIIMSYSSGGRATAEELNEVLRSHGKLREVVEINYKKNVMANMKWTHHWVAESEDPNYEFLFLLEK